MGETWSIYTQLSLSEARTLEDEYFRAVEAFLETKKIEPGVYGEVAAIGSAPSIEEIRRAHKGMEIPEEIKARIDEAQSTIEIEGAAELAESTVQVSLLRFLLEKAGNAVMDWGDYRLELSEDALESLDDYKSAGEVGSASAKKGGTKTVHRKERPGELRSVDILAVLERSQHDPDLLFDLRRLVSSLPELAQRYLEHIVDEGAVSDADAAKALGVPTETLDPVVESVHKAITRLA
jgi:hypothetical protein